MNERRIAELIGLAYRARGVASGEDACLNQIRTSYACLVILARDAGENTKKKFRDKCRSYSVPLIEVLDKERLGKAIGKESRAVVAITNRGLAKRIQEWCAELNGGEVIE
jgi:ribosomal protein L7Ae-like RNA K-turn-binding protein